MPSPRLPVILLFPSAFLLGAPRLWAGPQIWSSGPNDLTFTHASGTADADQITPGVAITRNGAQGILNSVTEQFYSHGSSPDGTEWAFSNLNNPTFAYGSGAANYQNLSFAPWETALGGGGALQGNIFQRPGVLHLTDPMTNYYIDIEFTAWGSHGQGNFTYIRSVAPPLLPGDTNGDGLINIDDFLALDYGYLHHLTGLANGDFNNDGTIDARDFAIIAAALNQPSVLAASASSPVPEPASLSLLACAAIPLLRRRRV